MRTFLALCLALAPASAFAEPKPGDRTLSPEQLLRQMGPASDTDMDEAIAAAAAHPLGTAENPVRVGGPDGERAYLARLHCSDGSRPQVGARTEAGVGAFGSVVGAYALDCGPAAPGKTRLLMDMYHAEHVERRAPAGFTLDSR